MNKLLETKIRALISKEHLIVHHTFPTPWHAVDWVVFYALAPYAKYEAVAKYMMEMGLRRKFYPHMYKMKGVVDPTLKSEAQGVKDFLYDLMKAVDNIPVFDEMVVQIEHWLEAYSMLLDATRWFRDDGKLYSHFDMKVRSIELGNESPAVDCCVFAKILLQQDPDRMATLLNSSFRGQDSRLKSFVVTGVPMDEAVKAQPLTAGLLTAFSNLLGKVHAHLAHLRNLPARAHHSTAKQSDAANNRKKGDGKAGLNNRQHGKAKDGKEEERPRRRGHHRPDAKPQDKPSHHVTR